jgi:hypothetical protein
VQWLGAETYRERFLLVEEQAKTCRKQKNKLTKMEKTNAGLAGLSAHTVG